MTTSQITLPNPRTWSPQDLVTVPRLRADVADTVALLLQRPLFSGQRTLGDPWPTATYLSLAMDIELVDTWNGHLGPPGTGTANYWCQLPGWYLCHARVPFAYTSSTPAPFLCGFEGTSGGTSFGPVNGAGTVNGSTSGTVIPQAVDLIQMTVTGPPNGSGDFIQPVARQDSGATVNLLASPAADLPTVTVRWVCANSGTHPLPVPPLAACPSPITRAWLNANVRDTVRFLTYPPIAKAHYTAGSATMANSSIATPQTVPLGTVDVDTYGAFNAGTSIYTAPVAGRYLVAGQFILAASSTTAQYACGVAVNGTPYWGRIVNFSGTSIAAGTSIVKRVRLNAGDQVTLIGSQTSGAALAYNTTAANQTRLIVCWEGI